MATVNSRRKVGVGLLGSGVVGEAIQDILFHDLKGQVGDDVELEIRKIYTRNPKGKKWFGRRKALFTSRPEEVLDDPGVDIVIEALGFQSAAQLQQFGFGITAVDVGSRIGFGITFLLRFPQRFGVRFSALLHL